MAHNLFRRSGAVEDANLEIRDAQCASGFGLRTAPE